MALTSKARQAALWKRAQHRASSQSGCKCVLRRAAEWGGGLGRVSYPERSRQADDLHAQRNGGMACGSGERGSRSKGWRRAWAWTWRVARGEFVPGMPGVRRHVRHLWGLAVTGVVVPLPTTAARWDIRLVPRGRWDPAESAAVQGWSASAGEVAEKPEEGIKGAITRLVVL
ncbi:MAG: hypothetical protein OXC69_02625 [Candidatus Tectomicrobia bacterium]|nr:hypothetical protein [Candidatus Tectomicrobia bacterium]